MLFASYCANDLSGSALPVLSLAGSEDGLSTPQMIADARHLLPADATMIEIPGASHASHASFGDYGAHPGDGTPTRPTPKSAPSSRIKSANWRPACPDAAAGDIRPPRPGRWRRCPPRPGRWRRCPPRPGRWRRCPSRPAAAELLRSAPDRPERRPIKGRSDRIGGVLPTPPQAADS
ncbi:alpha/beta hydrolase [Microbacterium lacticum]